MMFFILSAFLGVANAASSDVASLVQSHFVSRNASADEGPAPPKSYRITYGKTHGADHACLSEISFVDSNRNPLQARLQEASSCYGCPVSCNECATPWGDASKLFDMVSNSKESNAWSCTNVGSFIGGVGKNKPYVTFTLPRRPAKATFKSSEVGDWTPQGWVMQEYQPTTGNWETVATVVESAKEGDQEFFIQLTGTAESPAKWTIDYSECGGSAAEAMDVVPSIDPPTMSASFTEAKDLNLASTGDFTFDSGHGIAIDGDFGTITIGQTVYETRQLTFNFPSKRRSPDGNPAEGEMHIIMQKRGSLGIFDLAVVDILLQLKEEGADDDATHDFFLGLGLESLPRQGEPRAINSTVDLTAFSPLFEAGSVMTSNCSAYTPWYILGKPAFIAGSIQQAFLEGPPDPTPMPTSFIATLVNMTDEQKADALFVAGLKADGSPLITEAEKALIAQGPVPLEKVVAAGPTAPAGPAVTAPTS